MANKNEVVVNRQTVVNASEVVAGNGKFRFERKANGSGVVLTFGKTSLTIPNGSVGRAVASELASMLVTEEAVEKVKRTRRTRAEMEALRASQNNG